MSGVEMFLAALMISLMRGTPSVTFMLATPAKWNVLSVICVPGSPAGGGAGGRAGARAGGGQGCFNPVLGTEGREGRRVRKVGRGERPGGRAVVCEPAVHGRWECSCGEGLRSASFAGLALPLQGWLPSAQASQGPAPPRPRLPRPALRTDALRAKGAHCGPRVDAFLLIPPEKNKAGANSRGVS